MWGANDQWTFMQLRLSILLHSRLVSFCWAHTNRAVRQWGASVFAVQSELDTLLGLYYPWRRMWSISPQLGSSEHGIHQSSCCTWKSDPIFNQVCHQQNCLPATGWVVSHLWLCNQCACDNHHHETCWRSWTLSAIRGNTAGDNPQPFSSWTFGLHFHATPSARTGLVLLPARFHRLLPCLKGDVIESRWKHMNLHCKSQHFRSSNHQIIWTFDSRSNSFKLPQLWRKLRLWRRFESCQGCWSWRRGRGLPTGVQENLQSLRLQGKDSASVELSWILSKNLGDGFLYFAQFLFGCSLCFFFWKSVIVATKCIASRTA